MAPKTVGKSCSTASQNGSYPQSERQEHDCAKKEVPACGSSKCPRQHQESDKRGEPRSAARIDPDWSNRTEGYPNNVSRSLITAAP